VRARGAARDVWAVRWCDERASATQREPLLHPVLQKARGDVRERVYTGRVWCFTMPSGFIWTRRAHKDERGVVTKASRALLTGQCPPEAYFAQPFDYKSDVYSLAVILWELANRALKGKYEAPFSEYKNLTMDFQIIIQVAPVAAAPAVEPTAAAVDKPSKLASSGSRKGSRRKSSAATGASGAVSPRSPLAEEGRRASSKRESAVAATDNDDDNDTGAANNNNNNDDDDDDEESGSGEASGSEEKPSAPQRATSEKRRRRVKRSLAKSGTAKE
jgi:hypothetical protein